MKQISLLFSIGVLLCLISCAPGTKGDQKAEDLNLATPYNIMMVRHGVSDYATFKTVYMAHDSVRKAYGLESLAVGRGMDDPNMIIVMNKISDVQKAKDFAASPSLKEAMMKAGITGPPTVEFMNVIRDDTTSIPQNDRVMVSHHVKDFDAWVKVYDAEGKATRAANGIVDRGMARGIDDPNMVYLLFAVTDMAKANARMQSEELKKVMTDAGVDSAPSFFKFTWDTSK
ncbi:MAG: hypothetical protein IPP15_05530 [Saprospiraceae bacterium]|uniref:Uncharacterized protein n=1 Tax=Candidatus Opimibacter skivensis TaxID=2982028 RepID=A0A9D7SVW7_9BACT|nr:hypothetical protein [Candidatus Opimibacter skivensis]